MRILTVPGAKTAPLHGRAPDVISALATCRTVLMVLLTGTTAHAQIALLRGPESSAIHVVSMPLFASMALC